MKRAVIFAAMIFAFGLPFSAAQATETLEAGPIWNQQDAEKKCPGVCEKHGGWTGHWWTTEWSKMSVCQCKGVSAQNDKPRVTDIQLTASNTGTPRPGPKGYTRLGDWDVDAGGSHGTDGSTGHWQMALYVNKAAISAPKPAPKPEPKFSCEDKRSCGNMLSCEEAYYHLNTCGNKRLDHDKDGIPCEAICLDD